MSSQLKKPSGAPIRVKKRRSPVETDSDEEDIPREPARKFFRPNANATPANDTNSSSNANASTPEISYARKSSRPSAATTTITIRDEEPDQSRSKAIKDKIQEDLDADDIDSDDEDLKKSDELSEPACLPPTPPSPMSSPSPVVSRAITAIETNNKTPDTKGRRQVVISDDKKDAQDLKHECLTGQLALLIDSHNRFIDTIRHLFGAIVNQPSNICRSCSSKLDLAVQDN